MSDPLQLSARLARWLPAVTFPASGTPIRCGVSGGADSLAMMALGVAAGCRVTAVHVDHGQRPGSEREADLVHDASAAIGARFESATVDVEPGPNLEARLRAARLGVLGREACTGHTADDQAETVLINLMRGAGVRGLGAMRPGPRRPILGLRRRDTEAICAELGWTVFDDPSNDDRSFVRNRVRHELLPLLSDIAQRDVVPLLCRTADHTRSAADMATELAGDIDVRDARALASAPAPVAAEALQRWIRSETRRDHPIDAAAIGRVLAVAAGEAVAAEVIGGWRVARSGQRLAISSTADRDSGTATVR